MSTVEGDFAPCMEAATCHMQRVLAAQETAFFVLFHLSSMEVVRERFGAQGADDLRKSVYSCLAAKLQKEDRLYHWAESAFLAICQRPVREDQLRAELQRMLARNRDFPIQIGERRIMLRIPIQLIVHTAAGFADAYPSKGAIWQPVEAAGNAEWPDRALVVGNTLGGTLE